MTLFLTREQREELLSELRLERNRKYADRIRVILLLDLGETPSDIAKFLFLDETTVRNYKNRYKEGGLEKLVNDYYIGRSAYLSVEEQKRLILELESKVYPTTKSVYFIHKKGIWSCLYSGRYDHTVQPETSFTLYTGDIIDSFSSGLSKGTNLQLSSSKQPMS